MLHSIKQFDGYDLCARDGDIGHVREVLFDDERWGVRHVVAHTGGWLFGRKVLISPHSVLRVDGDKRRLEVALTRQQVKDAPELGADEAVSRRHEMLHYDHYGFPYYWVGPGLWGGETIPLAGATPEPRDPVSEEIEAMAHAEHVDHLRSSREVLGYGVEATDGGVGHVDDFLFDDRSWDIRYVVVDRGVQTGPAALVAAGSIARIDGPGRTLHVGVTRAAIEACPAFHGTAPLSPDDDQKVQRHYEGWQ